LPAFSELGKLDLFNAALHDCEFDLFLLNSMLGQSTIDSQYLELFDLIASFISSPVIVQPLQSPEVVMTLVDYIRDGIVKNYQTPVSTFDSGVNLLLTELPQSFGFSFTLHVVLIFSILKSLSILKANVYF
jgi:hypothetical protein